MTTSAEIETHDIPDLTGKPHFGHTFALLLISVLHSLHVISDIKNTSLYLISVMYGAIAVLMESGFTQVI
jgi:hypothetical protein